MVGFASGALSSAASSLWSGGGADQWQGFGGKFADSDIGMLAFGTVAGGAGASLTGGNFWEGAATGLVVSGLNHLAHNYVNKSYEEALKEYYALVVGESSDDILEAQGIGEVIIRRAELKKVKIEKGWTKKLGKFDAIGSNDYNVIMKMKLSEILSLKTTESYYLRVKGADNAFWNTSSNVSNGAYFFNATSQKNKTNIGFNFRMLNNGTFTQTAELGQTTFFKYSNSDKSWP